MFTGDFDYSGFSGTVNFGKPYAWTARPRALKVRYKAQIGKIDKVGSYDPDGASYQDKQDCARIFVAVVNWKAQHGGSLRRLQPAGSRRRSRSTGMQKMLPIPLRLRSRW